MTHISEFDWKDGRLKVSQGRVFVAPAGTELKDAKWAEVFFMPNDPSVETLGAEGQDLTDGIVQINLNYPVGTGGAAARSDFENIRASFPAGARPAYNGQEAVILSCGRSPGRVVDGWYRVSITISWYALIPR